MIENMVTILENLPFSNVFQILLFLESGVSTNCPSQWWPYAGHCYKIHREEKKIQREALIACRKEGGDLASIHSIEEFDFIISQLGYGKKPHISNMLPDFLPISGRFNHEC